MLACLLTALSLLPLNDPTPPALAALGEVHEGTVLMAGEGKLTLRDKDGENELFILAPAAKITLNGHEARLEDIKEGDRARVTAQRQEGKLLATLVEARSRK